jgi:hypothetical protein
MQRFAGCDGQGIPFYLPAFVALQALSSVLTHALLTAMCMTRMAVFAAPYTVAGCSRDQ